MTNKIKIVILDAEALREKDMDWSPLYELGDVTLYPHTLNDQLIERIGDADAIIINKGQINEKVLKECRSLKYIGITATGYDNINLIDCKKYGVTLCNVPGYSTESVAQQLFALLLEYATDLSSHSTVTRQGEWLGRIDDITKLRPMVELYGATMGILGYGNIGSAVARIAQGFGMKVLCHTFSNKQAEGIEFCSLDRLLCESDILTLHCRHTEQTEKIIDAQAIAKMKHGAVLCNVSRGKLIDDDAVYEALQSGQIAFYLADVLSNEPQTQGHPLLSCENTVITPHVAWATKASLARLAETVVNNMKAYYNGTPQNVVPTDDV